MNNNNYNYNQSRQNAPPRRRLTPEEIRRREIEKKRRTEYEKARRKKERQARRREGLKILGGRLLIFFIILFILTAVFGLIFLIFFRSAPDAVSEPSKIDYYYGGAKVRSASADDVISNSRVYFCFNDLADYIGFYESGSADEMKFILSNSVEASQTAAGDGNEEIIVFYTDMYKVTINGQDVTLDIPNKLIGEKIWVSTKFVSDYMENISVVYNRSRSTVTIARIKDEVNSDAQVTVYLPVSFKLKWADELETVEMDPDIVTETTAVSADDTDKAEETEADVVFATDLSDYEKYMNPTGDLRDAFLTLVNTENTLTEDYIPTDLMDVKYTSTARKTQQLREYACKSLEALYQEMYAAGYYNMAVYSGFRTYTYQNTLFTTYTANEMAADPSLTQEEAEAIVLTYSTRPGTSEHQTGLAVDMDTLGTFTTDFEYEPEYEWLSENAWKFGFILRFPKDKVDITTIQFEPWHYRYVGRYHAKIIHDSGLCLEEYVAGLQ